MDGSNGKIVELLERIAGGQDALREEMREELGTLRGDMREELGTLRGEMREEAGSLRGEMRALRAEMRHGFEQVSSRIDHIVTFLGSYHADHEERIRTLEERVLGKGKA